MGEPEIAVLFSGQCQQGGCPAARWHQRHDHSGRRRAFNQIGHPGVVVSWSDALNMANRPRVTGDKRVMGEEENALNLSLSD
jgi:hypothetical protein